MMTITPTGQACGAFITGVDLSKPLSPETVAELRSAWLEHHVLVYPEQTISEDDLERYSLYFGPFGVDTFFEGLPGHPHIAAVQRNADETTPIFASTFHTDWSFQESPPAATCLYGITIPPKGGDTLYTNQHMALEQMPKALRAKVDGLMAVHSAERAYAPDGAYGDADKDSGRSMKIVPSDEARKTQLHPLIRTHSETGREAIYSTLGYITGFDGMAEPEAMALLMELYQHQTSESFLYRHKWEPNMLVMWDNRSVLHCATGGYDGHNRLLHRTTIGEKV